MGENMKLKYILKVTLLEINQHLANFVITTVMLGLSLGLMFIAQTQVVDYGYRLFRNQSLLSVPASQLYIISNDYYMFFPNVEFAQNFYDFVHSLNDEEKGIRAGFYNTFELNDNVTLFCISEELLPVGRLRDLEGNEIVFTDKYSAAVGYDLREQYPIGSRISDEGSGEEYVVTQILRKDSEWLPQFAYNGAAREMTLDDKVLINLSTHAETNVYQDVLSSANSYYCYHPAMSEAEMNAYVQEHAEAYGIRIYYTVSLQKKVWNQIKALPYDYSVDMGLILILFGVSVIAIRLSTMISNDYKKRMFGILLSNGWTRGDIQRMAWLESGGRLLLSLLLALLGSYYWVMKLSGGGTAIKAYWLGVPVMVVLAVLVGYLCSRYPIRMLGSLKPKELIGGVYKE